MNRLMRAALVTAQGAVVVGVVVMTVVMFCCPWCGHDATTDAAQHAASGMLVAWLKVLVRMARSWGRGRSVTAWVRYGWRVAVSEMKGETAGGYLLGLLIAMWLCCRR
jgi:hypothetical protein